MSTPFVKVDLHGMTESEAIRVIDQALAKASPSTYQIQLIHGFHRGTVLQKMIRDYYQYDKNGKTDHSRRQSRNHGAGVERVVLGQ